MLRITLTLDDVLADSYSKLIDMALTEFETIHTRQEFLSRPMRELLHPKQQKKVQAYRQQPGFYRGVPIRDKALDIIAELTRYYEIFLAAPAMEFPETMGEKYEWLHRHFPLLPWTNIVFCGDMGVIISDYLIDSDVRNLAAFKGKGILYSTPYNLNTEGYPRVSCWEEIAELFLHKK